MATLVRIGYTGENGEEQPDSPEAENEEGEEGEDEVDSPKSPRFEGTGDMQGGAIEMGSLLPDSDVKRYESTENLNVTLHQCARDGNVEVMERLIAQLTGHVKKKINMHDQDDLSPLHQAARYNHVNMVKLLVDSGANVNERGEDGHTPLHFAARYKRMRLRSGSVTTPSGVTPEVEDMTNGGIPGLDIESNEDNSVIMCLISKGADINARDRYKSTPLHYACMRGNEVAAKELLSHSNIQIEATDLQNSTALHLAATHDEVEIVRMLLEKGVNLRCCDEFMSTPLSLAAMEGNLSIVQLLFDAAEKQDGWVTVQSMVSDQDREGNTALHLAVENTHFKVSKLILEKGADVNIHREGYNTPLHLASAAGDVRIVEILIDNKARIDVLNSTMSTPLHRAAANDHGDVAEFLLERGAKIEKRDKDNFTPLLLAACYGHADTIKRLIKRGADLKAVDKDDKNAIYWTAEEDHLEALSVLLAHPRVMDLIDTPDRYDSKPLHKAATSGHVNCLRALLDAGADMDNKNEEEQTPLHLAAQHGKTLCVRELVKRNKMVVNDEDEDSNTPLHLACLAGHAKVVRTLIEAGADIEARNCTLWTPLDCAAARGWLKTVRVLLEADAPVDPLDRSKTTPLHLACKNGHVDVVILLLKWNASVSQRDTEGLNGLDMAIENAHSDVAMALMKSSHWEEALRNENLSLATKCRDTPMRKLIRKMPDVAEQVFYNCTTSNMSNPEHPDYEITFKYEYLDDMYSNWREKGTSSSNSSSEVYDEDTYKVRSGAKPYSTENTTLKKNHPLMIMVRNKREDLLAHPLVTSLLRHKWNSFGRYFYYLNLIIYCVFVVFLTGFIICTPAPYQFEHDKNKTTCPTLRPGVYQPFWNELSKKVFIDVGRWIVVGLAAFNIARECYQFYKAKWNYIGWENTIEWICYITAFLLVIDFVPTCPEVRSVWQWQAGAVAIFLAWMDLVLFIQKVPRFGIYVVMFTDVLKTFMRFFLVFFLFIVAFALGFYTLLQNQYAFRRPENALIKTAVMMIGEFEFGDVFLAEGSSTDHDQQVYYEQITYCLFVFFMVIMSILIMNLLVGLAVDDIKGVQEQAVLKRLAMQVDLALDVESALPGIMRKYFMVMCETIKPNRQVMGLKRILHMESSNLSAQSIAGALNPELDEMEKVQEAQEKMAREQKATKARLKNIAAQNQKIEAMLVALLKHNEISFDDEDEKEEEEMTAGLFD